MRTTRSLSSALFLALSAVGVVSACGSDTTTPGATAPPGGAGAPAAQAGSANTNPGTAGTPATTTGSAGSSGSAAIAGSGGDVGASGSTGGGGTSPVGGGGNGGDTSGIGGSAGSGGDAAGGPSGGSGNSGGGSGTDMMAASVLNHYQLLDPCQTSYKAKATPGDVCPQDTTVKNQHIPLTFGGDASITYNVTLHVRGIMEGYWYSGGTLDPTGKTFYTGGVPTIGGYSSACKNKTSELPFTLPTEVSPTDNCWNGFNMFALTVSAPAQHYYLNYTTDRNSDRPPHAVYMDDYTVTIAIKGQAKLDFYIVGSDEHECYNFNKTVTGVTTMPSPYIGEFVQFDVTNVTRAP